MKKLIKLIICFVLLDHLFLSSLAFAVTIKNEDAKPFSMTVIENGDKHPLIIEANQRIDFCSNGCFITLDSGDKFALLGKEEINIINGKLSFK